MAGDASARCRFCAAPLECLVVDLGDSPLSNDYPPIGDDRVEQRYPLVQYVCDACLLVQVPAVASPEAIFGVYAYFSSFSETFVEHARRYAEQMREQLGLDARSQVVEIASNDGYLLQHFVAAGIPALGIEPASNVADAARERGVPTETRFFTAALAERLAGEGRRADLLIANNVFAHVPDLNGFTAGLKRLLAPGGTLTIECTHLQQLLAECQFDTIYHEHVSYFSLLTATTVLGAHGLRVTDVETLPTHGGSLRIHARHEEEPVPVSDRVRAVLDGERAFGLDGTAVYEHFGDRVRACQAALRTYLTDARAQGRAVAGYGAPAKACTLLNSCGVGPDLLPYTVDRNPEKQGRTLPGTGIPIHPVQRLRETRPDDVLILPWNLRSEIAAQLAAVNDWGGRLMVPIPAVEAVA